MFPGYIKEERREIGITAVVKYFKGIELVILKIYTTRKKNNFI